MFALKVYRFLHRFRYLLFTAVFALSMSFLYFSSKLKLEEDITKFIPKDKKLDEINFAMQNIKIKDKLVLNLFYTDSSQTNPSELMSCADELVDSLNHQYADYIKDLTFKISDDVMLQSYQSFYSHYPLFLEASDYKKINASLHPDSIRKSIETAYKTLLSPGGVVLGKYITKDPLNFVPIVLKKTQELKFDENFELNEGYIQTRNKKNLLVFITPTVPPTEVALNKKFMAGLDEQIERLQQKYSNRIKIEYYGANPVSLGNSLQVRKDSLMTSLSALFIISLLLFLFFRRFLVILYILLPVMFGALFSFTLLYFLRGEISAIAVGAGSIILGIAINYSLHFFTHYKHERSVEKVISDLTLPMLIGCTTTVGAFLSLQFTKSQALHDFGLFAGFSLIGAVLFSIIVLPHLLKSKRTEKEFVSDDKENKLDRILSYPFDKNKIIVITAFILTLIFAFTAKNVQFESDLMNMNYQSEKLKEAQQHLDAINKFSLQTIYLVTRGTNLNEALKKHEQNISRLQQLKNEDVISKYSNIGTVLLSDSLQKERIARWNQFWTTAKKDSLIQHLKLFGLEFKFKAQAFEPFYNLIDKNYQPLSVSEQNELKNLLVKDWVNEQQNSTAIVTMVKALPGKKDILYTSFENQPNTVVFDKQLITQNFIDVIGSDFNLVLGITAILVFGFMLLAHGRIELAIINFLPMFISWVWILGIMSIVGIKFNIINIIISTFIFGLGDDYSIFIMDGLSHEYKYGRKNLASYKTSILLSALTNIVGIGVLIFAKHPALKSIAAITIIGMCTVLFISFIVQPLFYNFMILRRRKRSLQPYTAINLFIISFGFGVFLAGNLLLHVFGFILFKLLPVPKSKKKLWFHTWVMYVCRFIMYLFVNVKKIKIDQQLINFNKPSIIIANHQSHIDLAFLLMLHPKIVVFTNNWVWNSPYFRYIVRTCDFYNTAHGFENSLEKMKQLTAEGYSVLIFPEGTRSLTGDLLRFHKGAFYLAEHLKLDIQPLLMHGTGNVLSKGDFYFKEGILHLKFLPRIAFQDETFGNSYKEKSKKIRSYMQAEFSKLKDQVETVDYFRPALIKNYIYKGPILEWYCRIKVKLEDNYRYFESVLPKKGKIVDIGCGYGFLPLMLGYMGKEREIIGVDYDEEKINIASNCYSKTNNIRFVQADATQYQVEQADAFIISDILHYLKPSEQVALIERCINKLNSNGIIIIRDADADKAKRHRGTRYTEFFSTNSGFNKTSKEGLHFTSAKLISDTLDKFSFLKYSLIDDTKLTSNVTFVIQRIN